jgi:hypothetical protein
MVGTKGTARASYRDVLHCICQSGLRLKLPRPGLSYLVERSRAEGDRGRETQSTSKRQQTRTTWFPWIEEGT